MSLIVGESLIYDYLGGWIHEFTLFLKIINIILKSFNILSLIYLTQVFEVETVQQR